MTDTERLYWDEEMPGNKSKKRPATKEVFGAWTPSKGKRSAHFLLPDCNHWRQVFELEKDLRVFASGWLDRPTKNQGTHSPGFEGQPDVALYLDARWGADRLLVSPGSSLPFAKKGQTQHVLLYPWEDWGVPENPKLFNRVLKWALAEIRRGKVVEIACMGGHGRTGTALACLLVLQGLTPTRAMRRVWSKYCEEAIESHRQMNFIRSFASRGRAAH